MSQARVVPLQPLRDRVSAAEWQTRVDLAACYRLVHRHGMADMIYTHITARIPGPENHLLINPYGLLFDEISASSLIKIDLDGSIVLRGEHDYPVNQAGYVIHSAVHGARHDVACVIHTHSRAGMAVSALKCGLLPLTQTAMRFYGKVAYHDYEGVALDLDERTRLVADLGEKPVMILRNHGLLTAGASVAEAFNLMYWFERACQAQVDAMSCNTELNLPSPEVAALAAHQYDPGTRRPFGVMEWPTMLRMLDREDASFRN